MQRPLHLNLSTPLTVQTLDAIQSEITNDMIAIIAEQARNVIPCSSTPAATGNERASVPHTQSATDHQSIRMGSNERMPSPPTTPGGGSPMSVPALDAFISNLVLSSRVQAGTLICTLVYLQRLRQRLPKEARGMECTCHRIFLATLIVAGKYLNDASPKNKYWARYSKVFTVAEVNLMEKQLLFLLDFDLRIDNVDLNEAAAVIITGTAKSDIPLTPTTPPFGSLQTHSAVVEPVPSAHIHYAQRTHSITEPVGKMYPPTLGLGGGNHHHHSVQPVVPANNAASLAVAKEIDNHANTKPSRHTTVPYPRRSSIYKRQLYADKDARGADSVYSGNTAVYGHGHRRASEVSASQPQTPVHLLHHVSAEDQLPLQPSPKKRAISRSHMDNVPQPSPVYYCNTTAALGTSISAASASTACFLQPLEQASISYASSRYQQQRYDPTIRRSSNSAPARTLPRVTASIPSLRATTYGDSTSTSSPPIVSVSYAVANAHRGAPQIDRCALRHQATLPNMNTVTVPVQKPRVLSSLQHSLQKAALPSLPPPACLASGSYTSDSSPVNTLVHDYSPGNVMAAITGYSRRQAARIPSTQLQAVNALRDAHSTLPVSALSALSFAPECVASSEVATDGDTLTNNRHAHPQHLSLHSDTHSSAEDMASSGIAANAGGGWHLKSKILQPFSTWFRSSRQHQNAQEHYDQQLNYNADSICQQNIGLEDMHEHKRSTYVCNTKPFGGDKGEQQRDVNSVLSTIAPMYLEPPVSSASMAGNSCVRQ
ncbi:PHO85 cyclin-1 [Coemansia sp. Benny D115]|nr:PHO85 cyclin-1 [Coemansia sp. Benny D115]